MEQSEGGRLMPNKCADCKVYIPYKYGRCDSCQKLKFKERVNKQIAKRTAKFRKTKEYGISLVKEQAEPAFWSSSHEGCLRVSINDTDAHTETMFRQWWEYRKRGYAVYTNLILKSGDRPDLIVISPHGEIKAIEVVASESEASIKDKRVRYPWPIIPIKAKEEER